MIFPIFYGLPDIRNIITWLLFIANVVFFLSFDKEQTRFEDKLSKLYEDKFFLKAQGRIYSQIIDQFPQKSNQTLKEINSKVSKGDLSSLETLGALAFRSSVFQNLALEIKYEGDPVMYDYWKSRFKSIHEEQKNDPSYILGLSQNNNSLVSQITYQFVHGGFLHLASNMWFLLIFGAFLERFWGSLNFLLFYLISGIVSAYFFIHLSGVSEAPLIGASGSISGIMGLVLVLFWNKKINCFYWVLPKANYHGFKKFPAWIVLVIWFFSDLAGYFGTLPEFGGVAHAAHIGGLTFGALAGFILKISLRRSGQNLFSSYSR